MSGDVPVGAAGSGAGGGAPRAIQEALTRLGRRLDELARQLPALVHETPAPPGSLLDELERRDLADLRGLLAVGSTAGGGARTLWLLLDRVIHQCDADAAAVVVPEAAGGLIVAGSVGLGAEGDAPATLAGGVVERAFREGEVVRGDVATAGQDGWMRVCGLSAVVALPAPGGTPSPRGVLVAGRRRPVPFASTSLRSLVLLADRLGLVLATLGSPPGPELRTSVPAQEPAAPLERPRASEASPGAGPLGRSAAEPAAGLLGPWGLTGELDLERVARGVVELAAERLGGASVALLLPEPAGFTVAARSRAGSNGHPPDAGEDFALVPRNDGVLGAVLESHQAAVPREDEPGGPLADLLGGPPRLVLPLLAGERVVALLAVGSPEPVAPVAVESLDALLPEAAMAIRNARLYRDAVLGLAEARGTRAAPAPAPPPAREFASLLAVVLGRLASLRERVSDPDGLRDLEVAEEAAWRAAESMRGLLGFAPGRRGAPLLPLDLGAVVREAVAAAEARSGARGAPAPRIQVDLEAVPPVRGSAEDLREMLGHLLDNAVEAGPPGAPVLVRARWDGGTHVDLDVVDSGSGMDEAVRSRALEPFFSTKGGGHLGLGLPVSRAIVARHQGELVLRSEPGQGTTVEVRLPTVASIRRPAGPTSAPVARVLLVEDEPPVREALLAALRQQGHVVHVAHDGRAALALLEQEPVDAVVTDLALPGVSGLEVARRAKALRPGTPVILVTAWPPGPDADRLAASGVDAVIDKPVGLSEFRATLALVLARRGGSAHLNEG